jgi:hypothetical protein
MQDQLFYRVNRPQVIFENIDGELILVNMEKGCYFSTDAVGAATWELIESGSGLSDIVEALRFRYDGNAAEIGNAVHEFIARLVREELIVADPAPATKGPTAVENPAHRPAFHAPDLQKYTDMRDMLLLDPVHDVEAAGWPVPKVEPAWPSAEPTP